MQKKNRSRKTHDATNKTANLAVKTNGPKTARRREGYIRSIVPKTLSRTRSDIATWRSALRAADNVDNPRRARLMNLYDDVMLCAHLTSQIELRQKATLLTPFEIKVGDEIDDQATAVLNAASWVTELNTHILDSVMYGHTLVELTTTGNTTEPVAVTLLPRQNVIPEKGMLLFREDDSKGLQYREVREFGNFILEFGKDHDYGLLNKAVPHVLFMRFAQSCWSELCEIYGIPPRFMKTDTQDPAMLDRADVIAGLRKHVNDAYSAFFCDALTNLTVPPRDKEALRREGLFPAVFLQVADAQRRNPDEAIAFLQDEFIKKNIQLPSAYTRNIDAFAEAAENLVLDLLAQGDEQ